MRTAFISHQSFLQHDTGPDHPESSRRLTAIEDRLRGTGLYDVLRHVDAPAASDEQLLRVHGAAHLEHISAMLPASGYAHLDADTVISPESLRAARHAAGALVTGVDLVLGDEVETAFCNVRPPGHHAERDQSMGFCLFNNIAVGAAHALEQHGLERIAIVDFDVHHGNGTEDIFDTDDRVLFCSSFQHPFYPFTPLLPNTRQRISVPLEAGAGSDEFRAAVADHWLPALEAFAPQLVLVSAGFDGHIADDMSYLRLTDEDYRWVTQRIVEVAAASAGGRIISTLEGGYELDSLARCVESHIRILMGMP